MEGYIGEIRLFAPNFAPKYWATCDGQTLAINTNQALFAILGTTYGGDGITTFRLPDLRGRTAIQPGQSEGTSYYVLGQVSGAAAVSLVSANLPLHTHAPTGVPTITITPQCNTGEANNNEPEGKYPAAPPAGKGLYSAGPPDSTMHSVTAGAGSTLAAAVNGGSQPIPLTPPYTVLNYIICLQGLFPSRD
ncbi:MAG TPA: tail fiber protein [Bacteroidia bacterium]|nr:tail fiber protein [Bacteroidia bacterium]